MKLRDATAIVIMDALNDNNGNIGYEDVALMSKARKTALTMKLMESDEFLDRLTDAIESTILEHLENYAEEYGIGE
ncbi:hypothetical protein PZE06_23850 [Robertmurraya sp. DFI.2.37]|uniref:hypothetical protein n=1 Tax=Robertmurraya sp. DFI.2.37 TaxID=3031819 RepID=UPI0012478826|nr:hypothetical protein [Robertmurraya sp. DFI.2.37]MDF1511169.1 hypothetical protein [Robertmurraya sp. DFI.2.37]